MKIVSLPQSINFDLCPDQWRPWFLFPLVQLWHSAKLLFDVKLTHSRHFIRNTVLITGWRTYRYNYKPCLTPDNKKESTTLHIQSPRKHRSHNPISITNWIWMAEIIELVIFRRQVRNQVIIDYPLQNRGCGWQCKRIHSFHCPSPTVESSNHREIEDKQCKPWRITGYHGASGISQARTVWSLDTALSLACEQLFEVGLQCTELSRAVPARACPLHHTNLSKAYF